MSDCRVTIRLTPEQVTKLDDLASAAGGSRAQMVRRLLDAADGEPDVAPLDRDGVHRLLSEQARRGSVPAARTLLDLLRESEADVAVGPGSGAHN